MDHEVWVEEPSVDGRWVDAQRKAGRDGGTAAGDSRWPTRGRRGRRVSPKRRAALAAIASTSVAAIAVVGGVVVGLPVSATNEGAAVAAIASPATTGGGAAATTTSTGSALASGAPSSVVSPTASGRPASGSIRDVDLGSLAYPASLCPLDGADDGLISLHDGFAGRRFDGYDPNNPSTLGAGARLAEGIAYGDVTGDGLDDAVALLQCYWVGGEVDDSDVVVISATSAGATVVGSLDDAGVRHDVTNEWGPSTVDYPFAASARVDGSDVVVEWGDDPVFVRFLTTVRYRLDAGALVAVGDTGPTDTWLAPADPGPTTDPASSTDPGTGPSAPWGTSIVSDDPLATTVPLSDGRTCGAAFADLGPLADAHPDRSTIYDDGVTHFPSAAVLTADGRATDARVFVGGASYKELTPQDGLNELELILVVGCVRGDAETNGLMVFRHSADGPEAIGWVFGPGPVAGASDAWAWKTFFERDCDLLVDWTDGSGAIVDTQRLRWDGAAFVAAETGSCPL